MEKEKVCLLEVLYSKPQTLLSFNQTKCNVSDFIFLLCDVCLLLPIVIADMYANPDVLLGPPSTFISSQFIVIFPIFSVLFALHTEHSLSRGQTISLEVKQHLWRSNNIFGGQTISLEVKQHIWRSNNQIHCKKRLCIIKLNAKLDGQTPEYKGQIIQLEVINACGGQGEYLRSNKALRD